MMWCYVTKGDFDLFADHSCPWPVCGGTTSPKLIVFTLSLAVAPTESLLGNLL